MLSSNTLTPIQPRILTMAFSLSHFAFRYYVMCSRGVVQAALLPVRGRVAEWAAEIICLKSVAWRSGDAADFIAN